MPMFQLFEKEKKKRNYKKNPSIVILIFLNTKKNVFLFELKQEPQRKQLLGRGLVLYLSKNKHTKTLVFEWLKYNHTSNLQVSRSNS